MSIVSEAEVKYFANVEEEAEAVQLQLAIDAAEDLIEHFIGYKLGRVAAAADYEYHDAEAERQLILLDHRNIATDDFSIRYAADWDWEAGNELDSAGYTIDTDWGFVHLSSPRGDGARRWKITYTGGWNDSASAPQGLKFAVMSLASVLYDRMKNGQVGLKTDNTGEAPVAFDFIIPLDVKSMLAGYVRPIL